MRQKVEGQDRELKEVDFQIGEERWNEYDLVDGGRRVRVKFGVQRIFEVLGPDGKPLLDKNGEIQYYVQGRIDAVGRA